MASSRGSGPLIRLLSDGCRWKVDEGLGPATLQVVTRVKPKACAGMQGSRVKLQGTGTVTGHMASNIIHAYSIMPGHMHAILNYRQHTHTNMHTAGGRCLRLLVGSSRRVNQWETKRREIQVPFYVYFFTSLCRASLMLSLAVGNVRYYSSHIIWIFMDGTFPSPAVKEKRRLQSRLKAQVKVLGRKGVRVCVLGVGVGGLQILMHGHKPASLIWTLSEGQGVQSSIPNQWHSPKCLPCRVQGSQISVQNPEWHKFCQTHTWRNLPVHGDSQSDRQTLRLNQTVPSPVTYETFVFLPIILKQQQKEKKLVYEIAWHMQRSTTYGDPIETKAVGVMD